MHLHEKIGVMRTLKGLTQKQMAKELHMSVTGYAKIERGETRLMNPKLEKIVTALGIDLKDFFNFDENRVFNVSFHDQSCCQNQNYYVNSVKEMIHESEKLRLLVEQKGKEIELLKEQINQLKQITELMKK